LGGFPITFPKSARFVHFRLGKSAPQDQIDTQRRRTMPLPHLFGLIAFVIVAAGATLALALWAHVPLIAIGFAAMAGSLVLGSRQWR
jgi:cytochrome c-type biogenesis protein CcmH/NrfG